MSFLQFFRDNARLLAAGFLLALASSFGQTFFIAIFAESLRETFALSHGQFGTIYMIGTLASAACLIQLGRLADTVSVRSLAMGILFGLAAIATAMAFVTSWIALIFVIFGLRLFGQGMLSHLSQTAMARWFNKARGRALAIAAFGYPAGEAIAPLAAIALIGVVGWRETWGLAAGLLILGFVPVLWLLLAKERTPGKNGSMEEEATGLGGRHWSRPEVVRQPLFWLLVPGILAPGFILTVVFFLPAHIAEVKSWDFAAMPSRYWIFALSSVSAAYLFGFAIDRLSARACLPFYQLPLACGLIGLWFVEQEAFVPLLMIMMGASAGAAATVHSALWAELYGTRHIGSIKALAHATMVLSTAVGPGIAGAAIDAGIAFPVQALWMAGYIAAICVFYAWIVFHHTRQSDLASSQSLEV